jgi:hypothetical protein
METPNEALVNQLTLDYVKKNKDYINTINSFIISFKKTNDSCRLADVINYVHKMCPELKYFYDENKNKFTSNRENDKGLLGKLVEFTLFGNLPNSSSNPDLEYADIKATHFKKINKDDYNAKERLTITNIGKPDNEVIVNYFQTKTMLNETKYYEKMKRGIIIVAEYEKEKTYKSSDDLLSKKILAVILYNLDDLPSEDKEIINNDYTKIRNCIINKCVSQKGQQYLHIHKHGNKASNIRALGFTNKFVTKIISFYLNLVLKKKGNSNFITF